MGPIRDGFVVDNLANEDGNEDHDESINPQEDSMDLSNGNKDHNELIIPREDPMDQSDGGEEVDPVKDPDMPKINHFNNIKNKQVRTAKALNFRKQKRKGQKEARIQRRKEGIEPAKPHTLETLREKDETMVGNVDDEENFEVKRDLELDEMASFYENSYEPKVLITFSDNPLRKTRIFGKELTRIIPNSEYRFRRRSAVKRIIESAKRESYTDVIIVNEDQKQPNGFLLIHLPNGPTAHFRLSNCKITKEMKKNYREISQHRPEVILNNFTTRLGHTVGRMLGALFHYEPQFTGRRAVTFHNQRDYIFFRHHRYEFTPDGKRARLRELGPRFTLKMLSLQQGTFDSKYGDYEWMIAGRRHQMETSRRKFFL